MSWACHVEYHCRFQGVRGGAREAVVVTRRRISRRSGSRFSAASADAGRRDRAARSPDPQPASCRRSFRRGYPARAAPSTRRPRPDRVRAALVVMSACVPTGPAGAVPVVRSRSGASLEARKALASAKTASAAAHGAGLGRSMRGTPVRASGTSNLRPWNPVVRVITGLSPCPWNREPRSIRSRGWPPDVLAWLLSPRTEHGETHPGQKGP